MGEKYISVETTTTLDDFGNTIGYRNVSRVLHQNSAPRVPNLGLWVARSDNSIREAYNSRSSPISEISWKLKYNMLNKLVGDSDLFEWASLMPDEDWAILSESGRFPGTLKLLEDISLPDSLPIFGNGVSISKIVYEAAMKQLMSPEFGHIIDPAIFSGYSSHTASAVDSSQQIDKNGPFQWFRIPWGEVSLYSSLSDSMMDFPVYPNELSDKVQADYTQMPELIYQYEPWQVYTKSGPRSNTYTFEFHRDMWTGNHEDGGAARLVRFCQANCYPRFRGSAVDSSIVTLYIGGEPHIRGVLTDVGVDWSGPLGHDNWYLFCRLTLSITEVSSRALNFDVVRNMGLIS